MGAEFQLNEIIGNTTLVIIMCLVLWGLGKWCVSWLQGIFNQFKILNETVAKMEMHLELTDKELLNVSKNVNEVVKRIDKQDDRIGEHDKRIQRFEL